MLLDTARAAPAAEVVRREAPEVGTVWRETPAAEVVWREVPGTVWRWAPAVGKVWPDEPGAGAEAVPGEMPATERRLCPDNSAAEGPATPVEASVCRWAEV